MVTRLHPKMIPVDERSLVRSSFQRAPKPQSYI